MAKLTRAQFFAAIAPAVMLVRKEGSPMFPSVRLAQSLLESGGEIHAWNNLGGIKVGSGRVNQYWQGEAVIKGTWEYVDGRSVATKAAFRAYKSMYHFYKDLDLLLSTARYERVRQSNTAEKQAQMLHVCGYATDPAYPAKLMAIIRQYGLNKYDEIDRSQTLPTAFEGAVITPIIYQGQVVGEGCLQEGVAWIPARRLGEALGARIGWTGSKATVNGIELSTILSASTGYVRIRDMAAALSLAVVWDNRAKAVLLE